MEAERVNFDLIQEAIQMKGTLQLGTTRINLPTTVEDYSHCELGPQHKNWRGKAGREMESNRGVLLKRAVWQISVFAVS
jgi:hypothetical protein